ncbi:FtsK/SpoIIIE family DNA translocase [Rhabdothermincola salaria]|uniref:FtsK/SpoIIIE family DNA translocase n=1 Tax=Rhabdothermincola salaria TaxID=2903142 RepID=UPI001E40F199|nr:DNA translocase FtsK [Rhabdothermincola salaria]
MATKQGSKTSRSSSGRTSSTASSRGSGSSRRTTKTTKTTKGAAAPKGRPSTAARRPGPNPLRRAFDGHGHDVWGVALIALGLLTALGVYADLAGPVGRGLSDAFGALVGDLRLLAPVALLVGGALLVRGPRDDDDPVRWRRARMAVGSAVIVVAAAGLLHLTQGSPELGDPLDDVIDAGGHLGMLVGGPLEALLSLWGAALVLVAVGIIGLVVLTGMPIRTAANKTAESVKPVRHVVRRGVDSLFELGSDDAVVDLTDDRPALFDGALDDDEPPRRRRRRNADPTGDETDPDAPADDPGGLQVFIAGEDDELLGDLVDPEELDAILDPDAHSDDADGPVLHVPTAEEVPTEVEQLAMPVGPAVRPNPWKLPPMKLLDRSERQEVDRALVEERGRTLESALAEHGVETRLVGMVVGPTVTRYELELAPGVKVARVTSLHKDIAYAMAAADVRILAPIPGKQAIGVEVPNDNRQLVAVGDILASPEAKAATNPLEVAIGRDINGRSVMADLAKMPHILIAGATGAGKSSSLNSLLTSILMRSTPDQVRLILVDPKRVEMGQYNRLPHLLTQVVTNPKKAANALSWAVKEMERRYDLLSEVGFRDINGYNAAYDRGDVVDDPLEGREYHRLPYILVVVDELADLMMVAARDVEESIQRIAAMARAVGIHLVIATQRPSVNVITGVIKANVPARLAFAVASLADSRVILDQAGAEKLLGKGDMLLLGPTSSVAQRIQGAWVTEAEVRNVVAYWRRQSPEVSYDDDAVQGNDESSSGSPGATTGSGGGSGDDDDEELVRQAMELIVRSQLGSTSMLQRKLRVGFARAGRLMDLLEQRGVVGPSEGSKARAVLMTPEELDELLGGDA